MTAPRPAGACFFLRVWRQSGATKTAGGVPCPIFYTAAPTQNPKRCQSPTRTRDTRKMSLQVARRDSSPADEWRRGEVMACAAALFPAIVWSGGQAGLDTLESNSTRRKRNYLSEVKESGSQAHSCSPIHSALIPVNSLAGMKVHEESSHNHAVGGQEPLPLYCSFWSPFPLHP